MRRETKVIGQGTSDEVTEITRYEYDYNGNMTYKGKETIKPEDIDSQETFDAYLAGSKKDSQLAFYEYNGLNQLFRAMEEGKLIEYAYNAEGLRTNKTVNGVMTVHVWDGNNMVAELDEKGSLIAKYIRGINLIAADNYNGSSTTRQYYVYNGHGDVVLLTNSSGSVTKTYEYDAFGVEKNPDPNDINPFRYCGEYFDKETETYYLRARYYSPGIGRFISEDPIRDGLNWYVYCENNPIILFDPFGLAPTKEEAAAMAEHIYQDIPLKDDNDPAGNRALRTVAGWRLIDIWSEGTVKMGIYIRDTDDWKNPSEYVLVFKGTSTKNVKDWVDDVLAYKTNFAPNMYTAMNFGKSFVESHSQEVTFVGHSKGGGEAIAAACYTFRNAITFNAANFAFERYHLSGRRSTIDNYYVEGEILSATIGTATIGTTHWLPTQYWITQGTKSRGYTATFTSPDPIANHSMKAIFRAFGME